MILKTQRWGDPGGDPVVCVHGIAQHGGVFAGLGDRLARRGFAVTAVDLRGHGDSGREPPWSISAHLDDLLETADALGIESATWIGHSFGGRLAAELADRARQRVNRVALLEPGLTVAPAAALRGAEIERLDWNFATADGALNALLSNETMVSPPRETLAAYVADDVRKGPDGRYRFRFCPSAVVVAWSEMTLPPPEIALLPTLFVSAEAPLGDRAAETARYRDRLGGLLTTATVPNGHNVLWEAPTETAAAVEAFLDATAA